jgi:hypothetical protein
MGALFGFLGLASARIATTTLALAIWLISRPGGWAVLVVLALTGVKLLPAR